MHTGRKTTPESKRHEYFMQEALKEARLAFDKNEVPVGCVIVYKDEIYSKGHNRRIEKSDPTSHAEIEAIQSACTKRADWRLEDMTLYVSSEPCLMCAGAIIHSRISKVVYGCKERKMGAVESIYRAFDINTLHHKVEYIGGVLEKECSDILTEFFKKIRSK
ncbi:MAG: tRNA adenosine(34) deaminase TadA [bacterium]